LIVLVAHEDSKLGRPKRAVGETGRRPSDRSGRDLHDHADRFGFLPFLIEPRGLSRGGQPPLREKQDEEQADQHKNDDQPPSADDAACSVD
jgi:hypothetical protein